MVQVIIFRFGKAGFKTLTFESLDDALSFAEGKDNVVDILRKVDARFFSIMTGNYI